MPTVTFNLPDIHQGPGYLYVNVATPAVGSMLLVDSSGTPVGGGIFMGGSEGAATVHIGPSIEQVQIDQETAPVDAIMTAEAASIEIELKESAYQKITYGLANATFSSGSNPSLPAGAQNYELITVGGIKTVPQFSVALISPRRGTSNPTKNLVVCLYNAFAADAYQVGFTRKKETMWKVKFVGLAVESRPQFDRVAQYYRQT